MALFARKQAACHVNVFFAFAGARRTISNARMVKAERKPHNGQQPPASLAALRRQIDEIDDRLHDLLMRARRVVADSRRVPSSRGKVRGLPAGARGADPAPACRRAIAAAFRCRVLVRIWRELLSGSRRHAGRSRRRGQCRELPGTWRATISAARRRLICCLSPGEATARGGRGPRHAGRPAADATERTTAPWWPLGRADAVRAAHRRAAAVRRAGNARACADALRPRRRWRPRRAATTARCSHRCRTAPTVASLDDGSCARVESIRRRRRWRRWRPAHLVEIDALVAQDEPRLEALALEELGRRGHWLGCYARPPARRGPSAVARRRRMTRYSHPASGHPRHRALCRRRGQDRRRRAASSGWPRTRARWARARARSPPTMPRPPTCSAIPTATRPRCARRWARHHGLDPARIVCGAGSDELISLLIRGLCRAGRRGALQPPRLPHVSDRRAGGGRDAGRRAGDGSHLRRRRDRWRGSRRGRGSSSSPIPTTRPAPISRATR